MLQPRPPPPPSFFICVVLNGGHLCSGFVNCVFRTHNASGDRH